MSLEQRCVIVGASLAGAMAAETLRSEGFDGRVVLIGEEAQRPYERPLLSKEYLRGDKPAARLYVHEQGFYADNDIELLTGTRVASLDPGGHEITLADGSRMPTAGSCCRPAPSRGAFHCRARSCRGCVICAPWATPTLCAPRSGRPSSMGSGAPAPPISLPPVMLRRRGTPCTTSIFAWSTGPTR